MSHRDVSRFVTHALEDEHLRRQLRTDPDSAFAGYELTSEERAAIQRADEHQLQHLGLDVLTARTWTTFHDVAEFAPDQPDVSGDLPNHG